MSVLLVIPARFASTRFPGKPLARLRGADGISRSLIEMTFGAAVAVRGISRIVIATDDERIAVEARRIDAEVVMTSERCANGTERCAEAVERIGGGFDVVVNLQGDAPLIPPWFVEDLVAGLRADPAAAMATPVLRCDGQSLRHMRQDRAAGRPGATTAVFGSDAGALYFSKEVIPAGAGDFRDGAETPVFHHVGLYAYRPEALSSYPHWPVGALEASEGLEQLRFLEQGKRILCVEVDDRGRRFWELNNPEDVARIEAILTSGVEPA